MITGISTLKSLILVPSLRWWSEKDVHSSPARAAKSPLAVEQSWTDECWNTPEKIPHLQRQKRSRSKTVEGAQS